MKTIDGMVGFMRLERYEGGYLFNSSELSESSELSKCINNIKVRKSWPDLQQKLWT